MVTLKPCGDFPHGWVVVVVKCQGGMDKANTVLERTGGGVIPVSLENIGKGPHTGAEDRDSGALVIRRQRKSRHRLYGQWDKR